MCLLWMGNYSKQRCSKNPGVVPSKVTNTSSEASDTNTCINGAVLVIIPCRGAPLQVSCSRQSRVLLVPQRRFPAPLWMPATHSGLPSKSYTGSRITRVPHGCPVTHCGQTCP